MKRSLLELGKSLLIVLLFCSLLLLTAAALPLDTIRRTPWLSACLQPFSALLGLPQAELTFVADAETIPCAAQPLLISVRGEGGRRTIQWDFASLDSAYDSFGGMLGQALDTASPPESVTQQAVMEAMSGPSICFDYGFSLPVELAAVWLDASSPETGSACRRFVLAERENTVCLYFMGESCSRAATQVETAALHALLSQVTPDGSAYGFETDTHLSAMSLLPETAPEVWLAETSSPCDNRHMETVAAALGFNPYDDSRYTDTANVTWFSESSCSLQIAASGEILLQSGSPERFCTENRLDAMVEYARSVLHLMTGTLPEYARLYLSSVTQKDGETICAFDYVIRGIPLVCGEGAAAEVTFRGGALTGLRLLTMDFSDGGERLRLLPPAQAAAVLPAGSELLLRYLYTGSGTLQAGWLDRQ